MHAPFADYTVVKINQTDVWRRRRDGVLVVSSRYLEGDLLNAISIAFHGIVKHKRRAWEILSMVRHP